MKLTSGPQLRAGRALLRMEQKELAELSGISPNTIRKMEDTDGPIDARTSSLRAIESVLVARGVSFYDDDEPGARLKVTRGRQA